MKSFSPDHMLWWRNSYAIDWLMTAVIYYISCTNLDIMVMNCRPYSISDGTLDFPLLPSTVGTFEMACVFFSPILTFIAVQWYCGLNWHELHNALLGYAQSNAITLIITRPLKLFVGRLRPDWLDRLRSAGFTTTQMSDWQAMCAVRLDIVMEGRKSFPSGHSSASMCEMIFLCLYLIYKFKVRKNSSYFGLVMSLIPLYIALFVCASRLHNFWHHGSDVLAGAFMGIGVAVLTFKLNFDVKNDELVPRTRSA
eukprot:PhF_6_TR25732/c0_g1_i1/m.36267/K18693/DPP1, DPPL, PLPP4_5; diacylglycerol diphosphate phosphatase / phosphatidate phosphatase